MAHQSAVGRVIMRKFTQTGISARRRSALDHVRSGLRWLISRYTSLVLGITFGVTLSVTPLKMPSRTNIETVVFPSVKVGIVVDPSAVPSAP